MVAADLGLEHLDGGTVFRGLARERGMSLSDFAREAEGNDAIDRALDDRLTARAEKGDVLVESRLAGWLVTGAELDAVRIWIECDEVERARRVAGRDHHQPDEALATNREREASERLRYQRYYGIDLADRSIYDLVLDSTHASPDQLVEEVIAAARADGGQPAPLQ